MRNSLLLVLLFLSVSVFAQGPSKQAPAAATPPVVKEEKSSAPGLIFNPDATVVTDHDVTIKGQRIPYKTTAGTMPVWDEEGKVIAGLFYS
jgi:carboxypeptidase C (cathepsin A)